MNKSVIIEAIFLGGYLFVTTIARVRGKNMFMRLNHNLMCMIRMKGERIIA